ncbi:MAG: glycosyltransferase [Candidatus Omnitrophica bacterium]|nr:glycosyltransferase [Candidatus Omnitrophota bacterium]
MWMLLFYTLEAVSWVILGGLSLHCLWLLAVAAWHGRSALPEPAPFDVLPAVTVQLPVFNERYVVERLLDAVSRLDYPRDRLEIQVLDDSTDDTPQLVAERLEPLRAQGCRVSHLRRAYRAGFKAGALAEGLAASRGEFLAIFDADFVPAPDFLRRTIHHFTDPGIGMVQTRWSHLNRADSFLTRAQALMLDGHFLIEQVARSRSGTFFNFNGSAGVWRKQAILEAGNWQADTLAEDLDISYRAQLQGWRFAYLPDVVVPAELPVEMRSLKAQHHRWAQGTTQAAIKLLPAILRSRQPLKVKLEACCHFAHWLHYPTGLLIAILIFPQLLITRATLGVEGSVWSGVAGLGLLTSTAMFYAVSQRRAGATWWRCLLELPTLMAVGVGLALNNTRAIWQALRGVPATFHRTPKYRGQADGPRPAGYHSTLSGAKWWVTEVALGLYASAALGYAASQSLYAIVPFLLPMSTGFLYSGLSSLAPDHLVRLGSPPFARTGASLMSPQESL